MKTEIGWKEMIYEFKKQTGKRLGDREITTRKQAWYILSLAHEQGFEETEIPCGRDEASRKITELKSLKKQKGQSPLEPHMGEKVGFRRSKMEDDDEDEPDYYKWKFGLNGHMGH